MKKSPRQKRVRKVSRPRTEPCRKTFSLELLADPKEIRKIEPFLQQINDVARLDDGTFYRLLMASTEAINNGILHGNKSNPKKIVYITCILDEDELVLRVRDQGKGFRPEDVPNPLEEKNLLKTSGRGIFLMRSLMDKVLFKITRDGTEVELVIDLKHHG